MPSVDQRIVEMQFDNAQFEKEVKTSLNTLDALKDKLNFASITAGLGDFQAVAKRFSLFNITDNLRSISDGFANMGIIGITVLQNLTNTAINTGKRMVSALSMDPVAAGWNKYEKKTIAVQTLLNSTGKTADEIYKQLDKLSFFTDQTSYEFTTMVDSIGKFTSAGVSLEPAVTAMQGIATWAALSGQNAQTASGAMYQLSQAIGSGRVLANDWMSIEKANMATKEFKQTVIDTAKELKIISKKGYTKDGTLVTTENFRSTLSEGWFNKEVLMKSLEKYGEFADQVYKLVQETGMSAADATKQLSHEIELVGEKGWKAARLARTFTDAMNATKDAVSSGWMKSFEILFGKFDEAVLLWTGLSEVLWNVFASGAEARNELLQGWKDLGGRSVLLDALADAYNGIVKTFATVGAAFRSIFPKTTKEQLVAITNSFHKLANWFKMGGKDLANLSKVAKGFFALLDIVVMAFRALGKVVGNALTYIEPLGSAILATLAPIADWAIELRNFVKESDFFNKAIESIGGIFAIVALKLKEFGDTVYDVFQSFGGIDLSGFEAVAATVKEKMAPMANFGEVLRAVFDKLVAVIKKLMPYLKQIWDSVVVLFANISKTFKSALNEIGFNDFRDLLNTGIFAALAVWIAKFVKGIYKLVKDADTISGALTKVFNSIGNSLKTWQDTLKAKTIMTIAMAIGILTVAIIAMSMIDPAKLTKALIAISVLFAGLVVSMKEFGKLKPATFKDAGTTLVTILSLIGIATSILILASALKKIADLPTDAMTKGIITIGALLAEINFFMKKIDPKQVAMQGNAILLLAGGMLILAFAIQVMGAMKPTQMAQGLAGIFFALMTLNMFFQNLPSDKELAKGSAAIILVALGLIALSGAVALIGLIDPAVAGQGILGIGALLAMVALFFQNLPSDKQMIKGAFALTLVSSSLLMFASVMALFGLMSWDTIGKGLIGVGYSLLIMALFMQAMPTDVKVLLAAAAIVVIASALMILAAAVKIFGSMKMAELGMGLLGIVSVLGVLIGMSFLMILAILPLGAMAVVLLAFGVAAMLAGVGVLALSMSFGNFLTFGVLGSAAMVAALLAIGSVIPVFLQRVAEGIVSFAKVIGEGAPVIAAAMLSVFMAIVTVFTGSTPIVAQKMAEMLLAILTVMVEYVPQMVDKGMKLIAGILKGIADNLQSVVEAAVDVMIAFLAGVTSKLPEIIDAALDTILAFINGMADNIRTHKKEIKEAVFNLLESVLSFIAEFIGLTKLYDAAKDVLNGFITGFTQVVTDLGSELLQLGKDIVGGIMKGLLDMGTSFVDTGKEVVGGFIDGVKKFLGIHSPSKVGVTIGEFFSQGFINGVTNLEGGIGDSATTVGKTAVNAMKTAISQVASVIDGVDSNFNPVIAPIIDMTDVNRGLDSIDGRMSEKRTLAVSGSRATAMSVSTQLSAVGSGEASQQMPDQSVSKSATYVFNQNNYSPKSLSRFDIYRQTKNQFAAMKGLVNDV